jgi:DNA-binding beta-propeller fold protein YncE
VKKYVCTLSVALTSLLCGQTYNISTLAGSVTTANGDGVNVNATPILNPQAIAIDSAGNVYIADGDAHRVRKIDGTTGVATVIAGQGRASGSDDASGPGISKPLNNPTGLTLDPTGKILYIGERDNHKIKKLDLTTGVLTTVVGYAGRSGYSGDGQVGLYARIRNPYGLATDKDGNLYFADRGNNRIRKLCIATPVKAGDCTTGNINDIAGIGPINADPAYFIQYLGDGGPATRAVLARPEAVAVDSNYNVFIADTNNNAVRRVDGKTGIITTVVGTCVQGAPLAVTGNVPSFLPLGSVWPTCAPGTQGTAASAGLPVQNATNGKLLVTFLDGTLGTASTLNAPRGLFVDSSNNLYIADSGTNRVRFLNTTSGVVTTFAGSGTSSGFAGDGGAANRATLSAPRAAVVAPNGDVYIADQTQGAVSNNSAGGRIRIVAATDGTIRTLNGSVYQGDNGAAANAVFQDPRGVSVDAAGNVYVADTLNQRVRKVSATDGTINTIAGRGVTGSANDTTAVAATTASLNNPNCAAVDASGSVFIADRSNNRVRKVDSTGNITTVAGGGTGNAPTDGILATNAILSGPRCVSLDNLGNLFIADTGNNAIRKVDANGIITTIAGTFIQHPVPSQNGAWVGVTGPTFLAVNNAGPVAIQQNSPSGDGGLAVCFQPVPVPPATTSTATCSQFGTAGSTEVFNSYLNGPQGISVDPTGIKLYIADTGNHTVRVLNLNSGVITMVAGGYTDNSSDGTPTGITPPTGSIGPAELTRINTPSAVAADASGNVFIADSLNYRILKVDKDGNAFVIAGGGTTWGDNKAALSVALLMPRGVAVDKDGNVYTTEALGIIRKLTPQK